MPRLKQWRACPTASPIFPFPLQFMRVAVTRRRASQSCRSSAIHAPLISTLAPFEPRFDRALTSTRVATDPAHSDSRGPRAVDQHEPHYRDRCLLRRIPPPPTADNRLRSPRELPSTPTFAFNARQQRESKSLTLDAAGICGAIQIPTRISMLLKTSPARWSPQDSFFN